MGIMARLTKEERAELEARLAEDTDDDDDEVEIGLGDGKYFRGRASRAKQVAAAHGIKLEPDPPADPKDPKADPKVKDAGTRFGGRRVS